MRKRTILSALFALGLLLAACAPQTATTPEATRPPAATEAPASAMTPSVVVDDQAISGGTVTVAEVISNGPGWIVIHAQADGKPGPILGYAPVADGVNENVTVQIDAANATETLYAMLHTDAGEVGTFEFPNGPDTPVKVGDAIITPHFNAMSGSEMGNEMGGEEMSEKATPYVTILDQDVSGGTVTVAEVVSNGPGWIVIHAQADGKPGPILGYAPVADGLNKDVVVAIDAANATETLYAMLHTDAGEMGTFEFPNGPDTPVKMGDAIITPPFKAMSGGEMGNEMGGEEMGHESAVTIQNFAFSPATLEVKIGTTITWKNMDSAPHTVSADDGSFDSGTLNTGDTFSFTFNEAGTFTYHCNIHPDMTATITVVP